MVYCSKCGKLNENSAKYCSDCGNDLNTGEQSNISNVSKRGNQKRLLMLLLLILLAIIVILIIGSWSASQVAQFGS